MSTLICLLSLFIKLWLFFNVVSEETSLYKLNPVALYGQFSLSSFSYVLKSQTIVLDVKIWGRIKTFLINGFKAQAKHCWMFERFPTINAWAWTNLKKKPFGPNPTRLKSNIWPVKFHSATCCLGNKHPHCCLFWAPAPKITLWGTTFRIISSWKMLVTETASTLFF